MIWRSLMAKRYLLSKQMRCVCHGRHGYDESNRTVIEYKYASQDFPYLSIVFFCVCVFCLLGLSILCPRARVFLFAPISWRLRESPFYTIQRFECFARGMKTITDSICETHSKTTAKKKKNAQSMSNFCWQHL